MSTPDTLLQIANDAVRLQVRIRGDRSRPMLVLVHGFPDNSLIWREVADLLQDDFCLVMPDVRGAGGSTIPTHTRDYRLPLLVEDLACIIDAVSPQQPVHLAGHDWGSIQCWEAVTTPRLQGRIASFTSISGPSLDHAAFWMQQTLHRPHDRARRQRVLNQLLHSWYIASFHLPLAPRLTWRLAFNKWPARFARWHAGLEPEQFTTQSSDGLHGIKLYRANFLKRLLRPEGRWTDIPVQLVVPTEDRYVTPGLFDDLAGWAPQLWRRNVAAGHWVQRSHPELVAAYLREFIGFIEGGAESAALRAARIAPAAS